MLLTVSTYERSARWHGSAYRTIRIVGTGADARQTLFDATLPECPSSHASQRSTACSTTISKSQAQGNAKEEICFLAVLVALVLGSFCDLLVVKFTYESRLLSIRRSNNQLFLDLRRGRERSNHLPNWESLMSVPGCQALGPWRT